MGSYLLLQAARNSPYEHSRHASYTPLAKVPDDAIKQAGVGNHGEGFLRTLMEVGILESRKMPEVLSLHDHSKSD
jgi:hypothetical protein